MDNHYQTIQEFQRAMKDDGKKEATIQSYTRDVRKFLVFLDKYKIPLQRADVETLDRYCEEWSSGNQGPKQNSMRRGIIGIRQFFRFLANGGEEGDSVFDASALPARLETPALKLSPKKLERLFEEAAKGAQLKAERDLSILSLFAFEGVKVTEMIGLKWSDFYFDEGKGFLGIKGERARVLILQQQTADRLEAYKAVFETQASKGKRGEYMFVGFKGSETLTSYPKITRHGLKWVLYELGELAKIPHLNTEMLRHHAVRFQLDLGKDPEQVQEHLGLRRLGIISRYM